MFGLLIVKPFCSFQIPRPWDVYADFGQLIPPFFLLIANARFNSARKMDKALLPYTQNYCQSSSRTLQPQRPAATTKISPTPKVEKAAQASKASKSAASKRVEPMGRVRKSKAQIREQFVGTEQPQEDGQPEHMSNQNEHDQDLKASGELNNGKQCGKKPERPWSTYTEEPLSKRAFAKNGRHAGGALVPCSGGLVSISLSLPYCRPARPKLSWLVSSQTRQWSFWSEY